MKNLFKSRSPSFDVKNITATIQQAFASAGLDTTSGPMAGVTETIRRALSSSGVPDVLRPQPTDDSIIDVAARVGREPGDENTKRPKPSNDESPTPGSFESLAYSGAFGSRAYKLYVPASVVVQPALVVMLHGCTQSASDFAAGTQMNRLAEEHGFLVVYPEQNANANMSKCWNWFQAQDQLRNSGEPGLLAGPRSRSCAAPSSRLEPNLCCRTLSWRGDGGGPRANIPGVVCRRGSAFGATVCERA